MHFYQGISHNNLTVRHIAAPHWGTKKASPEGLAFFNVSLSALRVLLDLGLGGSETGDGDAERGAGDVVDADRAKIFC